MSSHIDPSDDRASESSKLPSSTGGVDSFTSEITHTGILLLAGNALSTVLLAVITVFVARILGPDAYGVYSLVLLTPTYLTFAVDLGLPASLTHFAAKTFSESGPDEANRYATTAITAATILSLLATTAAAMFASYVSNVVISRPGTEMLVITASLVLAPQVLFTLLSNYFAATKRPLYSASMSVIQGLVKGLVQLILVLMSYSVLGAMIGHVAGSVAAALVGTVLMAVKVKPKKLVALDFQALKQMLVYGLPFYACIFMYQSMIQYEGILMGELATDAQIGNYKIANNFMFILSMTVTPLNSTFVPAFSRYDPKKDRAVLESIFREAIKYASFMTLPLAAAVITLSGDGVYALFGNEYAEAPLYLALLALHSIFSPIGANVIANSFNGLGKSHYVLAVNGSWAFFFMLLARPVMLWAGLPGMIVLFTASWIPAIAVGLAMAKVRFGMTIDKSWSIRIFSGTILAALPTWALVTFLPLGKGWPNLILGGPVFLILILTLYPLLGVLDNKDLDRLGGLACRSGPFRPTLEAFIYYERALVSVSPFKRSSDQPTTKGD